AVAPGDVGVAVLRRIAGQVQPVVRVEAPERAFARLHQVEGLGGRHPEVLRLVGGGADHRLLEDPVGDAVLGVRRTPGARPAELRYRATGAARHEVWRSAA